MLLKKQINVINLMMQSQILKAFDGARVHVQLNVDSIHEHFDAGELSRSLEYTETTFLQRLQGYSGIPYIDEGLVMRSVTGTAIVNEGSHEGRPGLLDSWPKNQEVTVRIVKKNYLWLDKNSSPMLGYVDPSSLGTEYRRPEHAVYVDLELLPLVADRLWKALDESIHRPNTRPALAMEWEYTSSYKNMQGEGSGGGLWFPREVLFLRTSHYSPEAKKDAIVAGTVNS